MSLSLKFIQDFSKVMVNHLKLAPEIYTMERDGSVLIFATSRAENEFGGRRLAFRLGGEKVTCYKLTGLNI